ncbi:MAG: energy-coupling factor transporter transmembrane component T family protein [Candidatus Limnocylindria bacterium]
MDEFEFARDVTVGQYVPGRSIVHQLDARAKLVAFVALVAAVVTQPTYIGNALAVGAGVAIVLLSGIPLRYVLSGIRPVVPILVLFTVFNFLFLGNYDPTGSAVLWRQEIAIGPYEFAFTVTESSLKQTVQGVVRIVALIMLTSVLTLTTTITALAKGVEALLAPFRRVKVPGHEIAMVLAIAYRFVPTVAEELERLMKAQASRGASFGGTGRLRFVQRTRQLIPVTVPLFVAAFKRAEDLINAMEARCYVGGAGRSALRLPPLTAPDWAAMGVAVLFAVGLGRTPWPF